MSQIHLQNPDNLVMVFKANNNGTRRPFKAVRVQEFMLIDEDFSVIDETNTTDHQKRARIISNGVTHVALFGILEVGMQPDHVRRLERYLNLEFFMRTPSMDAVELDIYIRMVEKYDMRLLKVNVVHMTCS